MRVLLLVPAILLPLGLSAQQWSAWRPDPTFPGIEVRERCDGFNEFASRTMWDVQLRNTYSKNVDVMWEAEPALMHGSEAQTDRAIALRPGETIEGHHTAPKDCSQSLAVRVDDVRDAASAPSTAFAPGPAPAPVAVPAPRPAIQGTWRSKDPGPYQKQVHVEVSGNTVTGVYQSPAFSFQITTPLPEKLLGSVSIEQK